MISRLVCLATGGHDWTFVRTDKGVVALCHYCGCTKRVG